MLSLRSAVACSATAVLCTAMATPALAADKPLSLEQAKSAATKQAGSKGRERYPFDTFTVKVSACKRDARFKAFCPALLVGVAACVETRCAPREPGLYKETCTWTSVITAKGKGHRQLRASATGFKCALGEALPDA